MQQLILKRNKCKKSDNPMSFCLYSQCQLPTQLSPSRKTKKLVVHCHGRRSSRPGNGYFRICLKKNDWQVADDVLTRIRAQAREAPEVARKDDHKDGIGIVNYLQGKNFFITGATGFLGKVLVEKLLRSIPDIGKIYLMINARDKEAAANRLRNEIIESDIFKEIKQRLGGSYESFMLSKVIPVIGNMGQSDLNLEQNDARMLARDVHLIINSAATTTFDERYDVSLKINTKGPCHLLEFGKKCNKLELFVQISSAYANGERKGIVMEKVFSMGDTIARENFTAGSTTSSLPPLLDVEAELSLALDSNSQASSDDSIQKYMKNFGLQRAHKFGWQDTYVFTKAMGEMMINHMKGDIPVVIIRPSIIESTFQDPFSGWIEGNRMMDPILILYGKGLISGFLGIPNYPVDVVPADMVVNAIVAILAKHGMAQKQDIDVYQVASSVVNPFYFHGMASTAFDHFSSNPYIDSKGNPVFVEPYKLFETKEEFISCFGGGQGKETANSGLTRFQKRFLGQIEYLVKIYGPYTIGQSKRFDICNTMRLMESMSEEEKETFGFGVKEIDWDDYFVNIHIPGLRKHVMKGRGTKGPISSI